MISYSVEIMGDRSLFKPDLGAHTPQDVKAKDSTSPSFRMPRENSDLTVFISFLYCRMKIKGKP
jgi:hypothetical protein